MSSKTKYNSSNNKKKKPKFSIDGSPSHFKSWNNYRLLRVRVSLHYISSHNPNTVYRKNSTIRRLRRKEIFYIYFKLDRSYFFFFLHPCFRELIFIQCFLQLQSIIINIYDMVDLLVWEKKNNKNSTTLKPYSLLVILSWERH